MCSTGESDLVTLYPEADLSVPFSMTSPSTVCLLPVAVDHFCSTRFVILSKRLRTCAIATISLVFVPSKAVCFVICTASARLNGTDVLVCRSTSYYRAYHECGACFLKRCFAVYVVRRQRRKTVVSCFCCV